MSNDNLITFYYIIGSWNKYYVLDYIELSHEQAVPLEIRISFSNKNILV